MKKERGAITLITLVTILFMLAFLVSTFTIIMNRRQSQAEIKRETKEIYESDFSNPILGICLGHQLLALTLGGKTSKLKFGHRGGNHPVKDLERNMVHITSQNHGYVVNELPEDVVATHININDGTIEGMKHTKLPIYSVQFHPEAAAGPEDSEYIFDRFMEYAL